MSERVLDGSKLVRCGKQNGARAVDGFVIINGDKSEPIGELCNLGRCEKCAHWKRSCEDCSSDRRSLTEA